MSQHKKAQSMQEWKFCSYFLGEDPSELLAYVTENPNSSESKTKFMCQLCGKAASRTKDVRDHVENIHFPNVYAYKCELCHDVLKSKIALKNHKMSHKMIQMWNTCMNTY